MPEDAGTSPGAGLPEEIRDILDGRTTERKRADLRNVPPASFFILTSAECRARGRVTAWINQFASIVSALETIPLFFIVPPSTFALGVLLSVPVLNRPIALILDLLHLFVRSLMIGLAGC